LWNAGIVCSSGEFLDTRFAELLKNGIKLRLSYQYKLLIICFLIVTVASGPALSFGVFFKPMLSEFGWTRAATSGAYSVSMLLYGLAAFIGGRASDRFGPRRVVTFGAIVLGLAFLLMSRVGGLWQLYLFYGVLGGIGQGCISVPVSSTVAGWFTKRRALMSCIANSGIGLGTAIVPPFATQLMENHGWRTSVLIIGIIAMALIALLAQFIKRVPSNVELVNDSNDKRPQTVNTENEPLIGEVFRTRQFWMLSGAWFLWGFFFQVAMVHIVPFATDLGMSAIAAATVLTIIGILSVFGRLTMGFAGDMFGNRTTVITGFLLIAAVYIGLSGSDTTLMLYLFAIIYGFFIGLGPLMAPIVADLFGLRALGTITGAITLVYAIGGMLGPILAGHVYDATSSYRMIFLLCGVLAIIAVVILWPLKRKS
jgi:MFS family permease